MNHQKMLQEIWEIYKKNESFIFDMECKSVPKSKPYTQKEAKKMDKIIGQIYMIAHSLDCKPCGRKWMS